MSEDEIPDVAADGAARQRKEAKAKGNAQAALILLLGVLALVVLAGLALLVRQAFVIEANQDRIEDLVIAQREQAEDVQAVLDSQRRVETDRRTATAAAIKAVVDEQARALAEHDARSESLLRRTLALTDAEVNAPGNQEEEVVAKLVPMIPRALRPPTAPAPAPTTRAPAPAAAPAPAPRPAPCETSGKSGRCRK